MVASNFRMCQAQTGLRNGGSLGFPALTEIGTRSPPSLRGTERHSQTPPGRLQRRKVIITSRAWARLARAKGTCLALDSSLVPKRKDLNVARFGLTRLRFPKHNSCSGAECDRINTRQSKPLLEKHRALSEIRRLRSAAWIYLQHEKHTQMTSLHRRVHLHGPSTYPS